MTSLKARALVWTAGLAVLPSSSLLAQAEAAEYAVKFACGLRQAATTASNVFDALSPGRYFTAINVRNASADTARVRMQVATTRAAPAPGQLLPLQPILLPPRLAAELDCREILAAAEQGSRFLKGFVILTADRDIDVVAVYTAGPGAGVQTMDVERVVARRNERGGSCPDLTISAVSNPVAEGNQTRIRVTVRNLGSAQASGIDVQVEDQSRPTGDRQASATIAVLNGGAQADVTLILAYEVATANWGSLLFTVDPKEEIAECDESNNQRRLSSP